MVAAIAPGKMVKEICAPYDKRLVTRGDKPGALVIHSGGLGTLPRGGSGGAVGQIARQGGDGLPGERRFPLQNRGPAAFLQSVLVNLNVPRAPPRDGVEWC